MERQKDFPRGRKLALPLCCISAVLYQLSMAKPVEGEEKPSFNLHKVSEGWWRGNQLASFSSNALSFVLCLWNYCADFASTPGVMLFSLNSGLCSGMAGRAKQSNRAVSCRGAQRPTKSFFEHFSNTDNNWEAEHSLPAGWLCLTHKMDPFDFAGDLAWTSDLTTELHGDCCINRH